MSKPIGPVQLEPDPGFEAKVRNVGRTIGAGFSILCLIAFCLGLVLRPFILMSDASGSFGDVERADELSAHYVSAPATLTYFYLKPYTTGSGRNKSTTYSIEPQYEFEYNGQKWVGTQFDAAHTRFWSDSRAHTRLERAAPDGHATAYFNPEDPSSAVLDPSVHLSSLIDCGFAGWIPATVIWLIALFVIRLKREAAKNSLLPRGISTIAGGIMLREQTMDQRAALLNSLVVVAFFVETFLFLACSDAAIHVMGVWRILLGPALCILLLCILVFALIRRDAGALVIDEARKSVRLMSAARGSGASRLQLDLSDVISVTSKKVSTANRCPVLVMRQSAGSKGNLVLDRMRMPASDCEATCAWLNERLHVKRPDEISK